MTMEILELSNDNWTAWLSTNFIGGVEGTNERS